MVYIRVNHKRLGQTASSIDEYLRKHKAVMKKADSQVVQLGTSWQGKDYQQVKTEWNELNAKDSTSDKMLQSLESYAQFLRFCENKYKDAQSKAFNKANRLP